MPAHEAVEWSALPDRREVWENLIGSIVMPVLVLGGGIYVIYASVSSGGAPLSSLLLAIPVFLWIAYCSVVSFKHYHWYSRATYFFQNGVPVALNTSTGERWQPTPDQMRHLRLVISHRSGHADLTWVHGTRHRRSIDYPAGLLYVRDYEALMTFLRERQIGFEIVPSDG